MSSPGPAGRSRRFSRVWLGVALLMVGLNLRPAVVAVSPLLNSIEAATGLSPAAAGVLTALPVFCFGAFAPFAPRIARRIGSEATLLGVLALLAGAFAIRLPGTVWALFLGAFLAGAAIAIGNVLVPALIKRDFPDKAGLMTSLYTTVLIGGATLTAGLTVPIQHAASFGWRPALAMWGLLAIIAIVCWTPQLLPGRRGPVPARTRAVSGLWREGLAWQVSLFMGLQSLNYYTMYSWLPDFFSARGLSAGQAGWMLSFSSIFGLVGALSTPFLAGRWPWGKGWLAVAACVPCAMSVTGLIAAPLGSAYAWMALLGMGQGAIGVFALMFIVLRSPDVWHSAALSSMAQTVGYLLAAAGPLAFGVLRDVSGGWTLPLAVTAALIVPEAIFGFLAGRDRLVGGYEREHPGAEPGSGLSRLKPASTMVGWRPGRRNAGRWILPSVTLTAASGLLVATGTDEAG